ncbi:MAG: hypothetical protein KF819_34810 [Labilithrix sp.]|nr:hypothetical protein [Labilithrix sp.]
MGAEREDPEGPDARARGGGTEPGLGRPLPPAQEANGNTLPEAVDFDALHAALGDPLDLDELPPPAQDAADVDVDQEDDPAETPVPRSRASQKGVHVGDSSGRSSATYSSARPHTIPPTRAPQEDINAPAVIVATEDTVPTAPPHMTVPLGQPGTQPVVTPGISSPPGPISAGHAPSGPHLAAPPASNPAYPVAQALPHQVLAPHQMTVQMPNRPINPRRPRTETVVVRPRSGPSMKQKLVAFGAMLVLVTAAGIAIIIVQRPSWLGIESPLGTPSATATASASAPPPQPSAAPSQRPSSDAPAASSPPAVSASASAAPKVKPKPPPAPRPTP